MSTADEFRQFAEHCLRQAEDETRVADKSIMLNLALAWVRLAQQVQQQVQAMPLSAEEPAQSADAVT